MATELTNQVQNPNTPGCYRKSQLAKMLGVSTRTIDRWMAMGLIPYSKLGATVCFEASIIDQVLTAKRIGKVDLVQPQKS